MNLPILTLILTLLLTFANSITANYHDTCRSQRFWLSDITAECKDNGGNYRHSGLDLDHCVGNYDGILSCADRGHYTASCADCVLDPKLAFLSCWCADRTWKYVHSTVFIGQCVDNWDGELVCFGHK